MKNLLRFLAFVLMVGSVYAQSNLPACQGRDAASWNNCLGTEVYPAGSKYVGEFKEGTLHSGKGGKVVKNPKQAVAIALSVAGKAKKK